MKLYFLDPSSRAAINVARLGRYGYDTRKIIIFTAKKLEALIVIGDGSPDDTALGIISYHLNDKVVGMVKPVQTHLSALDQLKIYIARRIKKIMVLIDQDDLTLDNIFDEAVKRMQGIGITVHQEKRGEIPSFRVYECSLPSKRFDIVLVVNGLEDVSTPKHTIEDHLVKAGGIDVVSSSKESWACLRKHEKGDVFRLLQDKDLAPISFPQHFSGCKCLEDINS